jgi:2-polyprenyl-6-methoxyphenol hydroxylase-like FAD-dependent oxidoreductase
VQQLPSGSVQCGTTVLGVHPGAESAPATLITEFGESEAELVVAADGIRSVLRGFLFPRHAGPRYAGYTAWRTVLQRSENLAADAETFFETWGPNGRRFAVLPLGDDRLYCYATVTAEPGTRAPDEVARLRDLFGDWHQPIPRIIDALTPAQLLHDDVEELLEPLPAYHLGRVGLLGDAAHAMAPDLGQGGGMAIEDAVVLADALGPDDRHVVPALEHYTRQRRPRTTAVARRSRRAGRLYAAPYPAQLLGARLMGYLPGTTISRGLVPVVDWRPPDG